MSNLTPSEFLTSTEGYVSVTAKSSSFHVRVLNLLSKRIRLGPAPRAEDSTIIKYHERVRFLLPKDRDKLHICIPFEKELGADSRLKVIKSIILSLKTTSELQV